MRLTTKADTLTVMLEVAAALKTLQDDPKALAKAIKEAYALSEVEKADYEKAMDVIDQSFKAKQDIEAHAESLKKLADAKADSELTAQNAKSAQELNEAAARTADDKMRAIEISKKELAAKEAELEKRIKKNDTREKTLDARDAQLTKDEEAIKLKVKQVQSLVG